MRIVYEMIKSAYWVDPRKQEERFLRLYEVYGMAERAFSVVVTDKYNNKIIEERYNSLKEAVDYFNMATKHSERFKSN